MAAGLKVRLADGSEIGPLDLPMVKSWYEQGLIGPDSPVQSAGSKQWTHLSQAVDLRSWGGLSPVRKKAIRPKASAALPPRGRADDERETTRPPWTETWATSLAGVALVACAGAAGYLHFKPQDAAPPLDQAPWWQIGLGLLTFALALLPGWELGRRAARVATVVAGVGLFPLLGVLLAQGVRGPVLMAVGATFVLLFGFFLLLADPTPHWLRAAVSLLVLAGGGAAVGYFGYAPETDTQRQTRVATTGERRWSDTIVGVSLQLPPGWALLKKDNAAFAAPENAKVAFAHPRLLAFGYLLTDSSPSGVSSLDGYLTRVMGERRKASPTLQEQSRTEVAVGMLTGRRASSSWTATGARYHDATTVWRDGWIYYALVTWAPEGVGDADLDAVLAGTTPNGTFATRVQLAVQKVTLEVPALTAAAAELLMSRSEAKVLEPDQAFRRSFDAVASALPSWKPAEVQEMGRLISSCYEGLSGRDRARLAAYVERVRGHQMTSPQEDREMALVMKAAVLRLPAEKRSRLQAFYERAVQAATAG